MYMGSLVKVVVSHGRGWTTVFLFGARAFATGVFQAVYVYTPEVYPTLARGAAMGIHTSAARVGAIITPFVAQASETDICRLIVGGVLILCLPTSIHLRSSSM